MDKALFNKTKKKASSFKCSSLNYVDHTDVEDYDLLANSDDLILLLGYNREAKVHEYIWAANEAKTLIDALQCSSEYIISFIPSKWVSSLESNGLVIRNAWHDYYLYNLNEKDFSIYSEYDFLERSEIKKASDITMQCRGQSRGFTGQTIEWFDEWLNRADIQDTAILVSRSSDDTITGVVCTGLYGHQSDSGPTVWIREAAVSPIHQGKGVGRKLITQALMYGKQKGAKKAFLAVDEDNIKAIGLYKSLGFTAGSDECEITMIKNR